MTFEELEEIRKENDGLDMYCYIHQIHPFTALSDRESHNAIQYHMGRIDQLEEMMMDIIDAYDSGDGMQDAIEMARDAVYPSNR